MARRLGIAKEDKRNKMNTPKAVAEELLALMRDKEEIRMALVELGASVAEEDGLSSYPDKIRGLKPTPIKIYKSQQFYQWLDEVLPPLKIDDGYSSGDLSWSFSRCPNLVQVPSIDGVDRAVTMESFVQESPKVRMLSLPDMTNMTNAKQLGHKAIGLEMVEVGAMPLVSILYYAFSDCSSLKTASLGDAPAVTNVFALFYNCGGLTRVKLSMSGGLISTAQYMFNKCVKLEVVEGIIHLADNAEVGDLMTQCPKLREIRIKGLSKDIIVFQSTEISIESVRYLINEARSVTGKTIYLPQKLVDDHEDEMVRLGEVASAKGWSINYR